MELLKFAGWHKAIMQMPGLDSLVANNRDMAGVYGVKTPLRDTGIWNWFMQFRISPELDHAFLQPWRALNRVRQA
ncbi:hypothetical protein N7512_003769 [Penicillium capsulatum]|nr:hypothetical protein N7512_003769 [Penicillium capsulatum]